MSKITDVKVAVVEIPLKTTWETFLYSTSVRAHAIVQVTTEDGIKGYGEASPAPAFMGESAYTIETVLNRHLIPAVLGQNVLDISLLNERMDLFIDGNTAAKAALDIAFHDAAGKTLKVPVYVLLGGKKRDRIELAWSVGLKDFETSVQEAKDRMKQGFKVMKVKVGHDIVKDAALVKRLREEFGEKVPLRMDANQGFTPADALTLLERVREYDPECFEQPCRKWDLDGMARVRKNPWAIPVMADESISSLHDARNVVMAGAADLFNIKVGKVGGLYRACQVAALVESSGYRAGAGSNLELGIGEAASVHFLTSQAALSLPSDALCGTELHSGNVVTNPMRMQDGVLSCPDTPGLGVEVDPSIFA